MRERRPDDTIRVKLTSGPSILPLHFVISASLSGKALIPLGQDIMSDINSELSLLHGMVSRVSSNASFRSSFNKRRLKGTGHSPLGDVGGTLRVRR